MIKFGDRTFYREILHLGFPVALQGLLSSSLSFIDSMMVGSLGETALAAVGASGQFGSTLYGFNWGLCCGGVLFMSQYHGVKDEDGIRRAFGLTMVCMLVLALLFTVPALFFPQWVIAMYADDMSVQMLGRQYLRIISLSYIFQALATVFSNLLNSIERVKVSLAGASVSMIVNTFLNWVLIYGKLGFPAMGVRGAAIASLIAAFSNVIVLVGVCIYQKSIAVTHIDRMLRWSRGFVREYIEKTTPLFINEAGYSSAVLIMNVVFGRQGEGNLAALSIFRTVEGLLYAFFRGLSGASSVMVGKRVGAGELHEAVRYTRWFAVLSPISSLLLCVSVIIFRKPLLGLFAISDSVRATVVSMLLIYLVLGVMRHGNYIQNNMFRAGGEPRVGTILELGGIWLVAVPAVLITGLWLKLPFVIVFAASMADEMVKLPISSIYMLRNRWIRPVTEQGQEALKSFFKE